MGRSRGGLTTKIHMVTASDRSVVALSLSGGECHDSPEGEKPLCALERLPEHVYMLMDRAYEGDSIRKTVRKNGFIPVVPPKKNRKEPWDYDKVRYRKRNEIERYFLRLKRFRKNFTRHDKLDVLFCGFIYFAMCIDALLV
ncbi:IS5 family transposase [Eubacteriales bacterium OttesenSCG-928-N13]|nr:IS5 family transposase [Eubacteriales bacterium OttesenSCG-928-N13]